MSGSKVKITTSMKTTNSLKIVQLILIILPLLLIAVRFAVNSESRRIGPETQYVVRYEFDVAADSAFWVRSFLPQSTIRQTIEETRLQTNVDFQQYPDAAKNEIGSWQGEGFKGQIAYAFRFSGQPITYILDSASYVSFPNDEDLVFVEPSRYIQSDHPEIQNLAMRLTTGQSLSNVNKVRRFFDYVEQIPSSQSSELTDALRTYRDFRGSCNGKSRLFVALCRSHGIPARVTGGLILEDTRKKTSHLWAEVQFGETWVPFDALNGHFATIPSNYLQLYTGDEFLITRSKHFQFDYHYHIEEVLVNDFARLSVINLWDILQQSELTKEMLLALLLLPLGALLVSIFKIVVGLKTYGVFLPVLIALALLQTGLMAGLALFNLMVMMVALLSKPLEHWRIQYTTKISVMLIVVIVLTLGLVGLFLKIHLLSTATPLFFPIIILTMISERFAQKTEEEGIAEALKLYGSTLVVTLVIYLVLSSRFIQDFILTFPEIILSMAGVNLMLGKWIGLRLTEYYRFRGLSHSNS